MLATTAQCYLTFLDIRRNKMSYMKLISTIR